MEAAIAANGRVDRNVGQRFRLLTPGERIQRGDECLNDDCETWSKVSSIVLRCDYNPMVFVPHRRQVPNALGQATGAGVCARSPAPLGCASNGTTEEE